MPLLPGSRYISREAHSFRQLSSRCQIMMNTDCADTDVLLVSETSDAVLNIISYVHFKVYDFS